MGETEDKQMTRHTAHGITWTHPQSPSHEDDEATGMPTAVQPAAISNQDSLPQLTRAVLTSHSHPCDLEGITEQVFQLGLSDKLITPAPLPESSINSPNNQQILPSACSDVPSVNLPLRPGSPSKSRSECQTFITNLTDSSIATIHILPSSEIRNTRTSASNLGFHVRIIPDAYKDDSHELLVLGRDEKAVEWLYKKVEVEQRVPSGGAIRTAAVAGATAGVVGAWASLAFVV